MLLACCLSLIQLDEPEQLMTWQGGIAILQSQLSVHVHVTIMSVIGPVHGYSLERYMTCRPLG